MKETPAVGTVVRTLDGLFGWVRSEGTLTASGEVVHVELLPLHAHKTPTGWVDLRVADLTEARVCGCALLGYRDEAGRIVRTDCDAIREPGKGRWFLPGHDAKAKGFLIRAWGFKMAGGFEHSLEAARLFGDKISLKVAAGIDNERRRRNASNLGNGESQATKAVMRNLQKSTEDAGHQPVGETFVGRDTDLETFTKYAKAWLRDRSELKTSTIDGADYQVAYNYFRGV